MESAFSVLLVVVVVAWFLARPLLRHTRRWRPRREWRFRRFPVPSPRDVSDVEEQLAFVSAVEFERQPLLNKGEYRVLLVLEGVVRDLRAGYRVMAQTNLGEVLRPRRSENAQKADLAFRSINSKRSDFIVVDRRGLAVLAVEYQGEGHYQGSAARRDEVKRAVFRSAGVALIEVPARFDEGKLGQAVRDVLSIAQSASEG